MGTYVNPGNQAFRRIAGPEYVDKTGLLDLMNQRIGTGDSLVCISRPRRFGKSYAVKMLTAYYDCSCDSHQLFQDKNIAQTNGYEKNLNRYNVICLDISGFISEIKSEHGNLREIPEIIKAAIWKDLIRSGFVPGDGDSLNDFLLHITEAPEGRPFIFIIDEWDALIREARDDETAQMAYLNLLRGWFKNTNFTPKAVAAAYMTGILPIKKDGSQSAISDFAEYTMVDPWPFTEYVGFTTKEVQNICKKHGISFETMKQWYDGYNFEETGEIYNPNSVMKAAVRGRFASYWSETSAAEGLMEYISQDYNGLTRTIAELIGGIETVVDTTGFANDLTSFKGKNDVLTLLIHLGYLAYNADRKTVRIPNEEIKREFQRSVHEVKHEATIKRLTESEKLFADTIQMNEDAVAAQIEKVHSEETVALHYNKEDSLRSVIKLAYYTYRDHYLQFEELPAGEGYADIVYLPRTDSDWPVLVIELKWKKDVNGAIKQILEKKYPSVLENYGRPILLVGITYDRDAKDGKRTHRCRIQEYDLR